MVTTNTTDTLGKQFFIGKYRIWIKNNLIKTLESLKDKQVNDDGNFLVVLNYWDIRGENKQKYQK